MQYGAAIVENSLVVPQKVKIEISDNVTISLLGLKAGTQEDA
jgi:hypothetical protein